MRSSSQIVIVTHRLLLRSWTTEDLKPFAKLNTDPRVRKFFPSLLSEKESNEQAEKISQHIEREGYGFWAVSIPNIAPFIGFIGIQKVDFIAPFTPAIEIGWRLAFEYWNHGYATEGALASLRYAFETLLLQEVVSFTAVSNTRSRAIMQKIGMKHSPQDDFYHPKIPLDNPLSKQVLYRVRKIDWLVR